MKASSIRSRRLALIGLGILLVAAMTYVVMRSGPLAPTRVTVVQAAEGQLTPQLFGIGTVEARRSYLIGPTTAGRVRSVTVDVGDTVKTGQPVAEMDPVDLDERTAALDASVARAGSAMAAAEALMTELLTRSPDAIAATKAGARFIDPHDATVKVLAQGLLDVGLLDRNKVGTVDDVIEQRAYFQFYMHRTGHWLGMDVHDCGSYVEPSQVGEVSERRDPLSNELIKNRPSRVLQPGMVLTIEPGLYVRPAEGVPEPFHHIGIRIEDDAIVTADGCELITRGVPVKADEIEAVMRA